MKSKSNNSKIVKLFGTDGIRGTANQFPMTSELVHKVGQSMGYLLNNTLTDRRAKKRTVLIGKDTRISGYMIEQALASGLNSMGVRVQLTGPLPTPGIGFLASNMRVDAGIVISASHNAFKDNGVKIFGADGFKIPDAMEREIERLVFEEDLNKYLAEPQKIGRTRRIDDASGRYIVYAKNAFPWDLTLDGVRIVLDCAHGASYKVAPAIFRELGADVIVLGDQPTGYNINDKVGALHMETMCDHVLKYRADVGISLDGDADRVIMVDEMGKVVNGDHILAVCALDSKEKGDLKNNTVVATQMSNFGLDQLMKEHDIQVVRTDVGDKHVVDCMRKKGFLIGGEQSGHIIFLDHSTTGDGCVAALKVLGVMQRQKKKLSELKSKLKELPQILINTRVKVKPVLEEVEGYNEILSKAQQQLGDRGRIFVRYSGTEPLVRVLVEGDNEIEITSIAGEVSDFLQKTLI